LWLDFCLFLEVNKGQTTNQRLFCREGGFMKKLISMLGVGWTLTAVGMGLVYIFFGFFDVDDITGKEWATVAGILSVAVSVICVIVFLAQGGRSVARPQFVSGGTIVWVFSSVSGQRHGEKLSLSGTGIGGTTVSTGGLLLGSFPKSIELSAGANDIFDLTSRCRPGLFIFSQLTDFK